MSRWTYRIILCFLLYGHLSCREDSRTSVTEPITTEELPDSVLLDRYSAWQEKVKHQDMLKYDPNVLASIEIIRNQTFLEEFATTYYSTIIPFEEFPVTPEDMAKHLYAIDLNNDHEIEVIYHGPSGGEPNLVQIFQLTDSNYRKIFSGFQDFLYMNIDDGKLASFGLINPGCCADPHVIEEHYAVSHPDSIPSFTITKRIGYFSLMQALEDQYASPKPFQILRPDAKLRLDCYFFDNVEHPYFGLGNHLSTYPAGHLGQALGQQLQDGREWIYVQMNPKITTNKEGNFISDEPVELRGWLLKSDTNLK